MCMPMRCSSRVGCAPRRRRGHCRYRGCYIMHCSHIDTRDGWPRNAAFTANVAESYVYTIEYEIRTVASMTPQSRCCRRTSRSAYEMFIITVAAAAACENLLPICVSANIAKRDRRCRWRVSLSENPQLCEGSAVAPPHLGSQFGHPVRNNYVLSRSTSNRHLTSRTCRPIKLISFLIISQLNTSQNKTVHESFGVTTAHARTPILVTMVHIYYTLPLSRSATMAIDTERESDVVAVAVVAVMCFLTRKQTQTTSCISSLQLNTVPMPRTPLVHNKPALLPLIVTRERNAFSKDVCKNKESSSRARYNNDSCLRAQCDDDALCKIDNSRRLRVRQRRVITFVSCLIIDYYI
ncbi:unnamed protein product [Trichogramma brassicae]|uniref:Uncharacterized protein n=1 Tax=Trichogramma brassicae TaxID=86971 RepID=A0A6H5IJZ1_9HYME|nr:unnamed protein product [Trichogramma brassicae]